MGRFVCLHDNYADLGLVSGPAFRPELPAVNLQNIDIKLVARTTNALADSTVVHVDLGLERQVGGVVLGPTNISPGGQYRIRSFSDAAMSGLLYDSGLRTVSGNVIDWSDPNDWLEWEDPGFWEGIPDIGNRDDVPTYLVEIIPATVGALALAQWWSIEVFDESNEDGYLEFGRLLVARAFRPAYNYTEANSFTAEDLTDTVETLGGRRAYWERGQRRILRVAFQALPDAQAFGDVFRLINRSRTSRQVFVVPDPDDGQNFQKRSFLATQRAIPEIQQMLVPRANLGFEFEEVL
jgi:hypothetical protein